MIKPDSLRAFLSNAVPELRGQQDRMTVFMEKGTLRARLGPSLGWEYAYTLSLTLLDFAGHPDAIAAPLLCWVRIHQPDLLQNPDRNRGGVVFEAELLDNKKVDLEIRLDLTERVACTRLANGTFQLVHAPEAPADQTYPEGFDPQPWVTPVPSTPMAIYLGDELIAEFEA